MNDVVTQPGTVALEPPSTVLNPQTVGQTSGGGSVSVSEPKEEAYKPQSIENVLEAENKRLKDEATEADKAVKDKAEKAAIDAKAKVEEADKTAKPVDDKAAKARDEGGKFAKAAQPEAQQGEPEKAAAEREAPVERASEGRKHADPPARFVHEAREKWQSTPFPVKAEIHRVSQEYEAEITKYKQSSERYEHIRQYDDIARSNGRELKDSLAKVAEVEDAMARNPIAGLDAVLREIGPRKADGSPLTLLEVAQHIVQNPQAYHSATSQVSQAVHSQPQAQQRNPEIDALRSEIHEMRTQAITPVIERFADSHPDFYSLEPQIAEVLKSGVIESIKGTGLSPEQKLAEAYRMVGGRSAPSHSDPGGLPENSQPEPAARQINPAAGNKSVRGAPSDGSDTATEETETDLREMLRKEMRKLA